MKLTCKYLALTEVHAVGTRLIKQCLLKNKKKPYIHLFD